MLKLNYFLLVTLVSSTAIFCETKETKPKNDSQEKSIEKENVKDPIVAETESRIKAAMRFSVTYDT